MAIPYFLKQDGDSLLFNQDKGYLQFFVPEKFFETKKAIVVGEYVNLIGILITLFMMVMEKIMV